MAHKYDRLTVPNFWTPKHKDIHPHEQAFGLVLAESDYHHASREGYVCMGYVSKQSPFGQGIFCGMKATDLRPATREEVLEAIASDHPYTQKYGDFKPSLHERSREEHEKLLARWDEVCEMQIKLIKEKLNAN
jgi:hypothetical protein